MKIVRNIGIYVVFLFIFSAAQADEYYPSEAELNEFKTNLELNPPVSEPIKYDRDTAEPYDKLVRLGSVESDFTFHKKSRDAILSVKRNLADGFNVEDLQNQVCEILNEKSVIYVDSNAVVDTIQLGEQKIRALQTAEYERLQQDMAPEDFQALDDRLAEMVAGSVRVSTDMPSLFDQGNLVVLWLVKQKCNGDVAIPPQSISPLDPGN